MQSTRSTFRVRWTAARAFFAAPISEKSVLWCSMPSTEPVPCIARFVFPVRNAAAKKRSPHADLQPPPVRPLRYALRSRAPEATLAGSSTLCGVRNRKHPLVEGFPSASAKTFAMISDFCSAVVALAIALRSRRHLK
eukprot:7149332-Prymnesium_polylepis.1